MNGPPLLKGFEREPVPIIGTALKPYDRPAEYLLAEEIDAAKGRAFRVEVRPGMVEGERYGLMIRLWGHCPGGVREGQPMERTDRVSAIAEGRQWIETGR